MMRIADIAGRLGTPWCGGCPVGNHARGFVDPFGVTHFAERRFTRRGARNFLLLAARAARETDPGYLNAPQYDYLYPYLDERWARIAAQSLGFRIPARYSSLARRRCLALAARRGVQLSTRPNVYRWAKEAA